MLQHRVKPGYKRHFLTHFSAEIRASTPSNIIIVAYLMKVGQLITGMGKAKVPKIVLLPKMVKVSRTSTRFKTEY